jgi:hypothetical protein
VIAAEAARQDQVARQASPLGSIAWLMPGKECGFLSNASQHHAAERGERAHAIMSFNQTPVAPGATLCTTDGPAITRGGIIPCFAALRKLKGYCTNKSIAIRRGT